MSAVGVPMDPGYPEGISWDSRGGFWVVATPDGWCDYPMLCNGTLLWDCPERIPLAYKQAALLLINERNDYCERERQRELRGELNEGGERYDWHL
jgi:hypothetical protein